jgi:hypothetical protein
MTPLLETAKKRYRAPHNIPRIAPDNIETLLGKPVEGPPREFIISEPTLRELLHMAARPPPAAPKPRPKPLWIRPKAACAIYGFGMTLLYSLINRKRINSKLICGARVIEVSSLDALGDAEPQARRRGRPRRNADAAE